MSLCEALEVQKFVCFGTRKSIKNNLTVSNFLVSPSAYVHKYTPSLIPPPLLSCHFLHEGLFIKILVQISITPV